MGGDSGVGSASGAGQRRVFSARIERIFDHAADTRSLFLRIIDDARGFRFVPGQFISISIPLPTETRVRPYTLASSPEDGQPLEICFNLVPGGEGVRYLFERRVGDMLSFTGPFGTFTMERPPAAETAFIAVATAIAPIRPMLRRALADPAHPLLSLLYAADSADHILYRREIEDHAANDRRFHVETLIAAPAPDLDARLLEEVERRWVKADANRARHFYICGVSKVILRMRDLLRSAGYERRAVHYEVW
jgi:ferredoxin-NADP reductase